MGKTWIVVASATDRHGRGVRVLDRDGRLYWQMMGKQHESMPYYWGHGVVGVMPDGVDASAAIATMITDPLQWEYDYAGTLLPSVPASLWHDDVSALAELMSAMGRAAMSGSRGHTSPTASIGAGYMRRQR